ncbi:MAG: 4Fe-4S dicluster domain-containing protein [Myxococcales bacterium]|nr:MAG: 4Fe-4S dicluster domain-containing protein [Myxococcales bacterium]
MTNFSEAGRPIMWNIGHPWIMYLLFGLALLIFSIGAWKRIEYWRQGKADGERLSDFGRRAWLLAKELLGQKRVRQSSFPGFFHSLIFYAFGVLIVTTGVVAFDYDFGTNFFRGWLYVFLTVAADAAGLLILVGVGMAVWRRYVKKPKTLETKLGDTVALALIALLVVTGFLTEGLRIAVKGDEWMWLTPVGVAFSWLFAGVSASTGETIHVVLWWLHTVLAMGWIASIPYTKFVHLLALPTNVFFQRLSSRGELQRVDLEALMSADDFDEDAFSVGVERSSDLTWKQRLDADSCLNCGRCEEICPAAMAGQPFGPRQLIQGLKRGLAQAQAAMPVKSVGAETANPSPPFVGEIFDENFIWLCRTCTACMEVCPACIDHVDTLIEMRRNEVIMQGRIPADAARAMKMLESLGNPFGAQSARVDWVSELGVRVVGPGEPVDVLYWIGCCTTFDPTKQKIATDLAKLLAKAGIDFGVLGESEHCCGDPARLMGQEQLFQTMAKMQIEELNSRKFKVLLTNCPHCYNVLKNEYPQFGGVYNVAHHVEFLHEMLWSGELKPAWGEKRRIAYHDPCYLGRYQKIYEAPREALKAIPGAEVVEMKHSRERSLCCGGGGGHFWMDIKKGERINNLRVEEAHAEGADTIITSCAYCMQMMVDSVKLLNYDEDVQVMDLATLVLNTLEAKGEKKKN